MILALLVLFLVFESNSSAQIQNFNLEATKLLLNNLSEYQQGIIPDDRLQYFVGVAPNTNPIKFNVQDLPQDTVVFIFDFLDLEYLKSLLEVSNFFNHTVRINFINRLKAFSPHFAFKNDLLNHAMICKLSKYFTFPINVSDPMIRDEYELATIKNIRANRLPYTLQFTKKFKSFLHEMLYDAEIEIKNTDEYHWRVSFIDKLLKYGKNSYPKTLVYYKNYMSELCSSYFHNRFDVFKAIQYFDLTIDFFSKGDFTEIGFIEYNNKIQNLNIDRDTPFYSEFDIATNCHFNQFCFSNSKLNIMKIKMEVIIRNTVFSQSFMDKFGDFKSAFIQMNEEILQTEEKFATNQIFVKVAAKNLNLPHWIYIHSCNPRDRFEIDKLLQSTNQAIDVRSILNTLLMIKNPTLAIIDAIEKLELFLKGA